MGKTAARCQKAWERNRRVRKLGQKRARVRVLSTAVKSSLAYGVSAEPQLRRGIIIAWPKVLDSARVSADAGEPREKWNAVTGSIAAVIATLLDAKWVPLHPAEWVYPGGRHGRSMMRLHIALSPLRHISDRLSKWRSGKRLRGMSWAWAERGLLT